MSVFTIIVDVVVSRSPMNHCRLLNILLQQTGPIVLHEIRSIVDSVLSRLKLETKFVHLNSESNQQAGDPLNLKGSLQLTVYSPKKEIPRFSDKIGNLGTLLQQTFFSTKYLYYFFGM